jgi:hypothetical protein
MVGQRKQRRVGVVVRSLRISGNFKTPVRSLPLCGELNHPAELETVNAILASLGESLVDAGADAKLRRNMALSRGYQ